jgi:hypothetical protein
MTPIYFYDVKPLIEWETSNSIQISIIYIFVYFIFLKYWYVESAVGGLQPSVRGPRSAAHDPQPAARNRFCNACSLSDAWRL